MSDLDRDTLELRRMVEADPAHPGPADVATLLAAGRSATRRRRIVGTVATLAVAGVVAGTAQLVAGGLPDRDADPVIAADPTGSSAVATDRECGVLLCIRPDRLGPAEDGTLLADPWVISELPDGTEEVVYGVRVDGVDLGTGEPGPVDVLALGVRQGETVHSVATTVQPGYEGVSPQGDPVQFWANAGVLGNPESDEYVVVGFVEGTPAEITWSTPDGQHGEVDGTNSSMLPGYTVFYLVRPLPADYEKPSYEKVEGGFEIAIGGGGDFPPPLTIHTSDGWSCSLRACGSLG
jgi:hypothetical protein